MKDVCFRYFNGTSRAEEERAILEFIREKDENRQTFEDWEKEWKQHTPGYPQIFSFNRHMQMLKKQVQPWVLLPKGSREKNRIAAL